MKKRPSTTWMAFLLGLIVYVGSYLALSSLGQYSSARATYNYAMIRVDWAPVGFVICGQWNFLMHGFYYPLYAWDRAYWHTDTLHSAITLPLQPRSSP